MNRYYYILIILISFLVIILFYSRSTEPEKYHYIDKAHSLKLPIIVISLEQDSDRRQLLFKKCGNIPYMKAVYGKRLDKDQLYQTGTLGNPNLRLGEIGCSLSHIGALIQYSGHSDPFLLVLEDDALIDSKKIRFIHSILFEIPDEIDVLMIGWHHAIFGKRNYNLKKYILRKTYKMWGSYSYLIRISSILPKLHYLLPIQRPWDWTLYYHFNTFSMDPPIVSGVHEISKKNSRTHAPDH